MALSGSVETSAYQFNSGTRTVILKWTAEQDIENNQTTIYWEAVGGGTYTGNPIVCELRVTIDGNVVFHREGIQENRENCTIGYKLAEGNTTITHSNDGSRSVTMKIEAGIYVWTINKSGSSTFTLDTIGRSSGITSASNVTLGNSCSVKWTPASTSLYYKLKFSLGDKSYTTNAIHPNTTSEYTYTGYKIKIEDYASKITSSATGTMTVYLYTYSNSSCSTQIGSTVSKTFTVTIPTSVKPTLESATVTIDNSANSVVEKWGLYVNGYSKAKITVNSSNVSGAYGSTISSFTISGGYSKTVNGTTLNYTGGTLSSGNKTFYVVANDSRGRSSEKVVAKTSDGKESITVYSYSKPSVSSLKVSRDSENNKLMIVKADWSYSSVNGKNSATATLYYKKSTSDKWIPYDGEIAKDANTTLDIEFEEASSYNFKLTVADALSSISYEASTSTIQVLMDFRAGGKGLGIGKICESNALEISMQSKFYNSIYISDDYEIRSLNADGSSRSILKGISSEGNTILGYSNYTDEKPSANTNIYGNDINIYSAAAGRVNYRPYYRIGDIIDVEMRTSGYLTSSGQQVNFIIPINKPIIGEPSIVVSSVDGFILRQDGNYTHGSDYDSDLGYTYAIPSNLTVIDSGSYGITVRAEFEATDNAVNNATIGIQCSLAITLS